MLPTSGEDVAQSARRGCGFVTPQGYFGDLGGAGTLPSPIWEFRALMEQSLRPAFQTCCYLPDKAPLPTPLPVFQAQAVTLTVAQAFKVAFEFWQVSKEGESCSGTL